MELWQMDVTASLFGPGDARMAPALKLEDQAAGPQLR
jgi:hypothetical protein